MHAFLLGVSVPGLYFPYYFDLGNKTKTKCFPALNFLTASFPGLHFFIFVTILLPATTANIKHVN